MTPRPLEARVRAHLDEIDAAGLRRSLAPPAGIDFSSNDYLNLARHPLLAARLAEAAGREGCGSTGSRLLRGHREAFEALEGRFARFKGAERSLYFSSGYLANIAVMATLPEKGDTVLSDERNHASLIDGMRLSAARRMIFPHNDVGRLAELLAGSSDDGHRFVVVESLFSMDGDVAPLREYAALCQTAGASLIVDEAHAIGAYGASGSGLIEALGVASDVCVSINTAGKALGVSGAFVAGPDWAIEFLIQRGRSFIFSTAPPPAVAAAIDAALDLVLGEPQRRQRLATLAHRLRAELTRAGIECPAGESHIVPVLVGDNDEAVSIARQLQAGGFDVRAIRPPTVPAGTARLRLSVNIGLSEPIIEDLVAALAEAFRFRGRERFSHPAIPVRNS
jgi:8-amino-7-oxononanoate synthase